MKSMGFVDAVKSVLVENYANFKGRARRSDIGTTLWPLL